MRKDDEGKEDDELNGHAATLLEFLVGCACGIHVLRVAMCFNWGSVVHTAISFALKEWSRG